jgi:hypothetical protein
LSSEIAPTGDNLTPTGLLQGTIGALAISLLCATLFYVVRRNLTHGRLLQHAA